MDTSIDLESLSFKTQRETEEGRGLATIDSESTNEVKCEFRNFC